MGRFQEFFEDNNLRMSMTRLMLFLSWLPATFMAMWIGTTEALGVYLAAYTGIAINNKWAERNTNASITDDTMDSGDSLSATSAVENKRLAGKSSRVAKSKK